MGSLMQTQQEATAGSSDSSVGMGVGKLVS